LRRRDPGPSVRTRAAEGDPSQEDGGHDLGAASCSANCFLLPARVQDGPARMLDFFDRTTHLQERSLQIHPGWFADAMGTPHPRTSPFASRQGTD
jgi:hypothetical protein